MAAYRQGGLSTRGPTAAVTTTNRTHLSLKDRAGAKMAVLTRCESVSQTSLRPCETPGLGYRCTGSSTYFIESPGFIEPLLRRHNATVALLDGLCLDIGGLLTEG